MLPEWGLAVRIIVTSIIFSLSIPTHADAQRRNTFVFQLSETRRPPKFDIQMFQRLRKYRPLRRSIRPLPKKRVARLLKREGYTFRDLALKEDAIAAFGEIDIERLVLFTTEPTDMIRRGKRKIPVYLVNIEVIDIPTKQTLYKNQLTIRGKRLRPKQIKPLLQELQIVLPEDAPAPKPVEEEPKPIPQTEAVAENVNTDAASEQLAATQVEPETPKELPTDATVAQVEEANGPQPVTPTVAPPTVDASTDIAASHGDARSDSGPRILVAEPANAKSAAGNQTLQSNTISSNAIYGKKGLIKGFGDPTTIHNLTVGLTYPTGLKFEMYKAYWEKFNMVMLSASIGSRDYKLDNISSIDQFTSFSVGVLGIGLHAGNSKQKLYATIFPLSFGMETTSPHSFATKDFLTFVHTEIGLSLGFNKAALSIGVKGPAVWTTQSMFSNPKFFKGIPPITGFIGLSF